MTMPISTGPEAAANNPLAKGGTVVSAVPGSTAKEPATAGDKAGTDAAIPSIPEGGLPEFYNAETGDYNWQGHAQKLLSEPKAEVKPEDETKEDEEPEKKVPEADGVNYAELEEELLQTGNIGRKHRDALNKAGIPDDAIDGILEVVQIAAEAHEREIISAFGGQEAYEEARAMFNAKATPQERELIAGLLSDPKTMNTAVSMIKANMPKAPLRGRTVTSEQPLDQKPFASQDEINQAVRDPRYRTDPTYRAQVERRASLSSFAVNQRSHTAR